MLRVSGAALTTETGVNGKRAASQVLEEPTYWELAQIVLLRTVRLSKHPFATGGMRHMHRSACGEAAFCLHPACPMKTGHSNIGLKTCPGRRWLITMSTMADAGVGRGLQGRSWLADLLIALIMLHCSYRGQHIQGHLASIIL